MFFLDYLIAELEALVPAYTSASRLDKPLTARQLVGALKRAKKAYDEKTNPNKEKN